MAKRRKLEAPDAGALADMEAGFAAKPTPDRLGLTSAPITQVAAEAARAAQPLDIDARIALAKDGKDAVAWRKALEDGRVLLDLPLDVIEMSHLIRDRMVVDREELEELKASIRSNGMRAPIEVAALTDGRYGLISGWRRLTVLGELRAEEGTAFATAKAILRTADQMGAAYTAMVEENELRAQLSPYERGRVAVVSAGQGAFGSADQAIDVIFAAASKSKRSKIRSFALIHEELGDMLKHPTELSERNGLRLAYALRQGMVSELRSALIKEQGRGAGAEWAKIEPFVTAAEDIEREPERGGRPKAPKSPHAPAKPHSFANDVSMEMLRHEDGFSIRLRGPHAVHELAETIMAKLETWLGKQS
ncbi:ParB N-terminal domain-containing protein [Pseudorhodobacter sp.]|uniref:ParB/RepB/Spo0J family partition protein n=1 Tax=Pseudorhodobacter sp. TaxID=1934400 RepID=UPI0026483793|nr:ParB N-terminal domain-containing protein [Pseudorhodobacter sp.]MDN5786642.1 ParB N-terminal domain-containing protein [Pseudorhodobacter sp.]